MAVFLLASAAAHAQSVTYFRLPVGLSDIVTGPDGNLWYPTLDSIVKLTPGAETTVYAAGFTIGTSSLIVGPDGRLWLASAENRSISAITTSGAITTFPLGTIAPRGLAAGADGNLWFGYPRGVGRMTPAGDVTLFPVTAPGDTRDPEVLAVALGPDGNIWFAPSRPIGIGRITPAGAVTLFPGIYAWTLAMGSDDQLWFGSAGPSIGRVNMDGTPGTSYTFTGADLMSVHAGPDGSIWFWDIFRRFGRIRNGEKVFLPLLSDLNVVGMTEGPDGNVWAVVQQSLPRCPELDVCPPQPPRISIARVNFNEPAVTVEPIPTLGTTALALMALVIAAVAVVAMRSA